MKRVVVAAHCQGKQPHSRDKATRLARKQRAKGVKVDAYKCEVCGKWHVGGVDHTTPKR